MSRHVAREPAAFRHLPDALANDAGCVTRAPALTAWGQELAGWSEPGGEPCLGGGCSSGARRCGPGRLVLARSAVGRAASSRPSRRAISSPSSWRLTAPAPATWCTPWNGPAASSRSAAARSVTCTGHRRSSVNNAPVTAPAASACTYLSCAESPSPMIGQARAMTAAGATPLTAVSAAALAAPYRVVGSGDTIVVGRRRAGEDRIAGYVHQPCLRRCRGQGNVHAAVGGGGPVRLPVCGVDDHLGPGMRSERRSALAGADVKWPPVHVGYTRNTSVEGRRDTVICEPRLACQLSPEEPAPADYEKIHPATVSRSQAASYPAVPVPGHTCVAATAIPAAQPLASLSPLSRPDSAIPIGSVPVGHDQ
jgi:hypothetical protein